MPPVARMTCGASTVEPRAVGGLEQDAARARAAGDDIHEIPAFQQPDVGAAQHGFAQGLHDGSAGAVAAGVHDAVVAVAGLPAEQRLPVQRPRSKRTP